MIAAASVPARVRIGPVLTAVVLTTLLLWLVGAAADVFLLLFLGILGGQYLGAVTGLIERHTRLHKRLAFVAAVLLSIVVVGGTVWLLIPPVVEQTRQLVTVLPRYITEWEAALARFMSRVPGMADSVRPGEHTLLRAAIERAQAAAGAFLPRVFDLFHVLISVFAVGVMSVYIALYPNLYREFLIALFPPIHRDLVRDVLGDLGQSLRAWIVGQMLAMLILGALTALGLWALDVPYWLTFGLFTGLCVIVPYFGSLISTVLPALFVLGGADGPLRAALVIALGTVIHVVEGNLVHPLIMSKQVELPPVLTIMAVLVCGKLLGPAGLLIAVPLTAVVMVLVRRILLTRIYEGHGFRRAARDRALLLRVPAPDGGVILPVQPALDLIGLAERRGG